MAELFATSKSNISIHIVRIQISSELGKLSVVQNYLTTAADGDQKSDQKKSLFCLKLNLSLHAADNLHVVFHVIGSVGGVHRRPLGFFYFLIRA